MDTGKHSWGLLRERLKYNIGWYLVLTRGDAKCLALGPFHNSADCDSWLDVAKKVALEVDPFTWFDTWATVQVRVPVGRALPDGKLNSRVWR